MKRSQAKYDREMAENQVVFRKRNEKMRSNIDKFNETAEELGEVPIDTLGEEYMHFVCECSDEKCTARVKVGFVEYKTIHEIRDTFIIKPEHNLPTIEIVTLKTPEFWVVKKNNYPSQTAGELKFSGLDHSK